MDEQEIKNIINNKVLHHIDEFNEAESAFFMYIFYNGEDEGAVINIVPAPDMEDVEEVMREVAGKIFGQTKKLPTLIVACEKIKYLKFKPNIVIEQIDANIELADDGLVVVAMEVPEVKGFIFLHSVSDMELLATQAFDKDTATDPAYTFLAITSLVHETLVRAGLVEPHEKDEDKEEGDDDVPVQFKFSRN